MLFHGKSVLKGSGVVIKLVCYSIYVQILDQIGYKH